MTISLHVIIDGLDDAALDRCYHWMVKNHVGVANLKAGEQFDRLRPFAQRLRGGLPECKIIVRRWPDDGAFKLYNWNGNDWYDAVALPLRDWLKQYDLLLLADNESVTENMGIYAQASIQAMRRATADGIGLGIGRTASGNPAEDHYAQMDDLWREFPHAPKCVYTPNEYHAQTPELSGGNIARYQLAWTRCNTLKVPRPFTTIGEYGYLHSDGNLPKPRLDPEWGYRRDGLTGIQAAALDIQYDKEWYAPYGVDPCVFNFGVLSGKWGDTSVDDDGYLDTITEYNASRYRPPPPVVIEPPEPPLPAQKPAITDARWKDYIARVPGNVVTRIRREPWVTAPVLTSIPVGVNFGLKHIPQDRLTPAEIAYANNDPKGFWQIILIGAHIGYIRSDVVRLSPDVVVEPPKPPEEVPVYVTKAEMNSALDKLRAEFEARLVAFRKELAARIEADETAARVAKAG